MNWKLLWRGFLFKDTVRSRCCILLLTAQVLFPCAAAQHDAAPPQQNSEVQAHAHSHSEHSGSPRPQAQRPVSYYSCSEGDVIKDEACEFFKDLHNLGFSTQLPVQQPKLQLPDMLVFNSSGQPCYLTALHVHSATTSLTQAFCLGVQQASDSSSLCVGSQSCRGGNAAL